MNELITVAEVISNPTFPKRHKEGPFYIVGDEVRMDFINTDGKSMYRYFYFDKRRNPAQTGSENLIYGARFVS